ncbi:MAG: ATP-binding protein [Alphaproteobacteria bacterium]
MGGSSVRRRFERHVLGVIDRLARRPGAVGRTFSKLQTSRTSTVVVGGLLCLAFLAVYIVIFVIAARIIPEFKVGGWRNLAAAFLGLAGLGVIAIIIWVTTRLFAGPRSDRPGNRLSANFIVEFTLIAMIPITAMGAFAGLLYWDIQSLVSDKTASVYDDAVTIVSAYSDDATEQLRNSATVLTEQLKDYQDLINEDAKRVEGFLENQARLLNLRGVFIVSEDSAVSAGFTQGVEADKVTSDAVSLPTALFREADKATVVQNNAEHDQLLALARLSPSPTDRPALYVLIVRAINPDLHRLGQSASALQGEYRSFEQSRTGLTFVYLLTFVLCATGVLLIAIAYAVNLSRRVAQPLSDLADAASRISQGDLEARVLVGPGDDEINTLGHTFNQMAADLQIQRDDLVSAERQSDQRRRFTEAVLSGVTAGVIGLDWRGRVTLINKSACSLLGRRREDLHGHSLADVVPELGKLVQDTTFKGEPRVQADLDVHVEGGKRNLIVRITSDPSTEDRQDFVVTFDDVTDLVAAQRMSAWADVARRIAHEIRNPLTPIQLSAERLRRKYAKEVVTQPEVFQQCTETIIRQVGDMGRMVDEFSSFARMPGAVIRNEDLCELVRQAIFLQRVGYPDFEFVSELPDQPIIVECDGRQISQALINLLKNAVEAIDRRQEQDGVQDDPGRVVVKAVAALERVEITVTDNGCGLPKGDRHRLTEPYITTRNKGTGLGLAIVQKIMEDHAGTVDLDNAVEGGRPCGAVVRLTFPINRTVVKSDE